MNIHPITDKICVKQHDPDTTTASGIIVSSKKTSEPVRGTVVAVGPGKVNDSGEREEISLQPGDVVLFLENSGVTVTEQGEEFVFLTESHILGKLA